MRGTDSYRIIRREPAHDDEISALYADVFGDKRRQENRRRWQWQYFENPTLGDEGPIIWIAVDKNRVIGQLATIPYPMWWDDREVRASVCMDFMVRKEVRGRGVGIALSDAWADNVDVGLALGLTPSSYPLFRKMFSDVGPVPAYVKVLNAKAVVRRRFGRVGGTLVGPLVGAALELRSRRARGNPNVEVQAVSCVSDEYDDLWRRVRASFAAITRRDGQFLTWKYLKCPFHEYRILEARTHGALTGYISLRSEGDARFRRGIVSDLFCDTSDIATQDALIDAALDNFRAQGVARVDTYCLNALLGAALRRHGFLSGRTAIQCCVVHRHASSKPLSSRMGLSVMLGDGDLDRG